MTKTKQKNCENCGCELNDNEEGWCDSCDEPEGDVYA